MQNGYNILIVSKAMTQNTNTSLFGFYFQFCKKLVICVMYFCICVITFEPIKIKTHSASQDDHLNFSFVEDIYVVGEKMAKNGKAKLFC